jgi:hypothetical protein
MPIQIDLANESPPHHDLIRSDIESLHENVEPEAAWLPRGFMGYDQTSNYAAGSINDGLSEKNHTCINIVAFTIVTLYM